MNATPRFDLVDIVQTLKTRWKFVLMVSLIAAAIGAIFYIVKPTKYKSKVEFIVLNPLNADRNNIFRKDEGRFINYFDDEYDIDKVIATLQSDSIIYAVANKFQLTKVYHLQDTDQVKLLERFKKNYNVKRTDYGAIELTFANEEAHLAVGVMEDIVKTFQTMYQGYFNAIRANIYSEVNLKVKELDSVINSLTDTLALLRNQYGIYDIISPARHNMISSTGKGSGVNYAKGVEVVQNIESIKDQEVVDRVHFLSIMNEVSTGGSTGGLNLIKIISPAHSPKPAGPGGLVTVLACWFVGLFFSSMFVLISTYYRILIAVER